MARVVVPLIGLESDAVELTVDDLTIRCFNWNEWADLEPSRIADVYLHIYAAQPRYFLEREFPPHNDPDHEIAAALQDAGDLVLALRLGADWDLIGPEHVVWYLQQGGFTYRPAPDTMRSRFLTRTFGDTPPVTVERSRRLGGATDTYADALVSLGGKRFPLTMDSIPHAEVRLALIRDYLSRPGAPDVDVAVRNFAVGRSRLSSVRHRLIALFTALEAVYGGYRRRSEHPSLGRLIAHSRPPFTERNEQAEQLFESPVRRARNALAHGDDRNRPTAWEEIWQVLSTVLRNSLPVVMGIACWTDSQWERYRAITGSSAKVAPSGVFQDLVELSGKGSSGAADLLDDGVRRLAVEPLPDTRTPSP